MAEDVKEGTCTTSPSGVVDVEYAGFWRRALAFVVDLAVVSLIVFALAVIFPILMGPTIGVPSGAVIFTLGILLYVVVAWLYWALTESSSKQGTFGKELLGIVVTDINGKRLSFIKATKRFFGKIASALVLLAGFIMIGLTARKQGLHDLLAGSLVILKK